MANKSRNWVFTLNNPTEDIAQATWPTTIKFLLAVLEVGSTGTVHYQGYLELGSPRALTYLLTLTPLKGAHWEVRRGTRIQAISYCLKTIDLDLYTDEPVRTTTDIFYLTPQTPILLSPLPKLICHGFEGTYSELTKLAKKSNTADRLNEVQDAIRNGATDEVIAENYFDLWIKYNKAFMQYRLLHAKPRDFKTTVILIQGPTGTGKSKYCLENFPGAYWKPRSEWWDGYHAHDSVILDEFYGWLPFDLLLRLCDRYPLNVHVKGGTINFVAKTLVITTNKDPRKWYKGVYFESFQRRVDEWRIIGRNGTTVAEQMDNISFEM